MNARPILLFCAMVLPAHGEVRHQSSFHDSLQALPEGTWKGKAYDFVPGVAGRAVHLKGTNYLALPQAIDFNSKEGTLSFWLKTDWPGNDGKKHDILGMGAASGIRVMKDASDILHFLWHPGGDHKQLAVGFSVATTWPADDWRHLAFTWKNGSYAVYLDGILRQREMPVEPPAPVSAPEVLALGCISGAPADLAVDELIVHDTELDRREVRAVFVAGIEHLEHRDDPRLLMRALINEQPSSLILDTGATLNCLFKPFALQAGVKARPSYRGGVMFQEEADAQITLEGGPGFKQRFAILENAAFRQHGILGWAHFFEANRLRILWEERTMLPLSKETAEEMTQGWEAHHYPAEKGSLTLPACTIRIDDIELKLPLLIDTGMGGGLTLTPKTWAATLPKLSPVKRSLNAAWTATNGQQTFVNVLPQRISMLGAQMTGISVCENQHQQSHKQNEEHASIGLAALSFFDVLIDGKEGTLWLRPRATPAIRDNVNYSGLLVYKAANEGGNTLEVLDGSPAWRLGLRSEDSILAMDGRKFDVSSLDEMIMLKDSIDAGKPARLKLLRGAQRLEVGGTAP